MPVSRTVADGLALATDAEMTPDGTFVRQEPQAIVEPDRYAANAMRRPGRESGIRA